MASGMSVGEAANTLTLIAKRPLDGYEQLIANSMRNGQTLADSLTAIPRVPRFLISLIRSGEQTSDLNSSFTLYLTHTRRLHDLRQRLLNLAIYPTAVAITGLVVMAFLACYVIPRFAAIFEGVTTALPLSARLMVSWSHLIADHRLLAAALILLPAALIAAAVLHPAGRAALVRLVLRIRPLRDRARAYFLATWYRTTGLLLDGGIPFAEALHLSHDVLPPPMRAGAYATERAVRDGYSPSQAYQRGDMATVIAEQLLSAGERTGDMGSVLRRIADFHENEITRQIERAMKIAEPLVMALIGLGVGAIVILMYLPIFELASTLQ